MSFAICLNLDQSKILSSGNELNLSKTTNFLTLPNRKSLLTTILNLMKMVKKLSRRVEKAEGKGEIARSEQFLLFPQCFQRTCTADT